MRFSLPFENLKKIVNKGRNCPAEGKLGGGSHDKPAFGLSWLLAAPVVAEYSQLERTEIRNVQEAADHKDEFDLRSPSSY